MSRNVLHLSTFLNATAKHGGYKRSLQLAEIAQADGIRTLCIPSGLYELLSVLFRSPLSAFAILPIAVTIGMRSLSLKGVAATILYGGWLHAQMRRHGWPRVMLEVSANQGVIMGNVLVSFNVRFSAYPHNIEFMVPGQNQSFFRSEGAAFAAEMLVYRAACRVHAISELDAAVLRAMNVELVQTLLYSPPKSEQSALYQIRKLRVTSDKTGILILGTAWNPPTRLGLEGLLDLIRECSSGQTFTLAGFGTEVLAPIAPSSVRVLGGVSDAMIRDLMVQAEALLVCQPPTSGMLTRLVEASFAGIPTYVLGGYFQARGMDNQGVHSISSLDELFKAMPEHLGAEEPARPA
ncbi:MAG: hypothetical protein NXH81_15310 [Halieaceae bacterium]|uniref:hypothetical protein n=1 Tax=Haliea alexandrii TaxID=2448162 RepID=UPI000F0B5621|nr:hypothetical protein [Haliea alexandrii]MCR9186766.1 hypothetical protein [Halieaceae bacterium]